MYVATIALNFSAWFNANHRAPCKDLCSLVESFAFGRIRSLTTSNTWPKTRAKWPLIDHSRYHAILQSHLPLSTSLTSPIFPLKKSQAPEMRSKTFRISSTSSDPLVPQCDKMKGSQGNSLSIVRLYSPWRKLESLGNRKGPHRFWVNSVSKIWSHPESKESQITGFEISNEK